MVRLPQVGSLTWEDCRLLIDSVLDYAIFMLDPAGHVLTWNSGAERIKGYSAGEIVGQHFSTFYPREAIDAGKPARELEEASTTGRAEDEGWRLRKDGSRFWANVVLTAVRDETGRLRGFAKVTRDLTLRRASEEELRQSEERFHHLVDAVSDYAIFLLDLEGRVATWNPGARKLKGYQASEIVGRHFSAFYTEKDRASGKPQQILETVLREGRFEDEGWRVRKDGTLFWANVVISPLRNDEGEVIAFAKVTRDLTDRRATEEDLRKSEERFRLLIESVSDYAIYMLDPEGRVTTWNVGAERMKGYGAAEIIGRHFSEFFPPEDVQRGKPERELMLARERGRFEDEGWRVAKGGARFWANVVVTPLHDAHGDLLGFTKITRDLTVRREAEATQRRLLEERTARAVAEGVASKAEEANRIKDEFLATVSHELRTPLNAIVGWAAMLRQGVLEPRVAKALEVIERNANAQVKIVEDILDVSRIVTGKLLIDPQPADLVPILNQAIEIVRPSADAKQISIAFAEAGATYPLVADAERLQQVAWNLLSNAVKFTDKGGAIEVEILQHNSSLVLQVTDTGRGIEADFMPYVFDRFKQADASTTRRFGGLGLGLSLVRHIVELHGGSVAVKSEGPGKGSTFAITLPVRAVMQDPRRDSAPSPEPKSGVTASPGALQDVRVLVVDDDADARELLTFVLQGVGAVVEASASAAEGFAALRRFRPQVLVSDIGMPDEDGYAFARRVQRLAPEEGGGIPTIALTAYTRSEDRTKALAAGFTTHIGKPVNPDDLVAAVANLASFARH
ncbi:MAG TPA: PAS domain S-box protein [Polyangiaceae bacterium]